jgi:protein-tyrosine phosphatase
MALDYSDPEKSANFRDVGIFINLILGRRALEEGRPLRGGSIKNVLDLATIGNPATVLCLKNGSNPTRSDIRSIHFPRPNTSECYLTVEHDIRSWLKAIVRSLAEPNLALPLYIHCHSGRDRTGVVVAALLRILNIPPDAIIEEYLLSEGADRAKISSAMEGIADVNSYFPSSHSAAIRAHFLAVT